MVGGPETGGVPNAAVGGAETGGVPNGAVGGAETGGGAPNGVVGGADVTGGTGPGVPKGAAPKLVGTAPPPPGTIRIWTYASRGGPPGTVAGPMPGSRSTVPSPSPAGIRRGCSGPTRAGRRS
ncbi:hypothetical protein [Plantactinospora veratri]